MEHVSYFYGEEMNAQKEVLGNLDILALIFDTLAIDESMSQYEVVAARRALCASALTCKAFTEVALNALWRVMPSLFPLLQLIPSFKMYEGSYILSEDGDEITDWTVYDSYARRIRELIFRPPSRYQGRKVSALISLQMTGMRGASVDLVPLMKVMRVLHGYHLFENKVLLLPSTSLEVMEFNDSQHYSRQLLPSLLTILCSRCLNLRQLILRSDIHNLDLSPVSRFLRLRSLELVFPRSEINFRLLDRISRLEHLQDLSIHFTSLHSTTTRPRRIGQEETGSSLHFPSLRRLEIQGTTLTLSTITANLDPSRLRVESVYIRESPMKLMDQDSITAATHWPDIAFNIAALPHLKSLEVIPVAYLTTDDAGANEIETVFLSMDSLLGHLVDLPNRTTLQQILVPEGGIPVTDKHTELISSNFTGIKTLIFPIEIKGDKHQTTINSLISLARGCPDLETLQIPLSSLAISRDNIPSLESIKGLGLLPHPLQALFFDDQTCEDLFNDKERTTAFARCIDTIFPHLQKMAPEDDPLVYEKQKWVESLVLEIQRDRISKNVEEDDGNS